MLIEKGIVLETSGRFARVAMSSKSGCGSCSMRGGCGTSLLEGLFPQRGSSVMAQNPVGARKGDRVTLGIEAGQVQQMSFLVYLLPLMSFIIAAGIGAGVAGELGSIMGGIAGLMAGLILVRFWSLRPGSRFSPMQVRITAVEDSVQSYIAPIQSTANNEVT